MTEYEVQKYRRTTIREHEKDDSGCISTSTSLVLRTYNQILLTEYYVRATYVVRGLRGTKPMGK